MAAVTPLTPTAEEIRTVQTGVVAITETHFAAGVAEPMQGMLLEVYFFANVGNDDTWASGIPHIRAVAWQGNQPDTHRGAACLTDQTAGTITFQMQNAGSAGYLWVLRGGAG